MKTVKLKLVKEQAICWCHLVSFWTMTLSWPQKQVLSRFIMIAIIDFELSEIKCCKKPFFANKDLCESIIIPKSNRETDKIYRHGSKPQNLRQICIPFSRSEYLCDVGETSMREQFNAITIFVDMSSIYGSEKQIATPLRTKERDLKRSGNKWKNLGTLAKSKERWNLPRRSVLLIILKCWCIILIELE